LSSKQSQLKIAKQIAINVVIATIRHSLPSRFIIRHLARIEDEVYAIYNQQSQALLDKRENSRVNPKKMRDPRTLNKLIVV